MDNKPAQTRGQIYLLMGYLGSGKTTFIRNLLQNKKNIKYAVIQNEFASGQMGIQQPLIMDESGIPFSSFLQLPNGCICCSAKNDLIASIEYILENTDVKNIVVETNGLADPAEFWFDQQMKIQGEINSVISIFSVQKFKTIINAQSTQSKTQSDRLMFQKQIVFANKALITFVDKSTTQEIESLQNFIRQKNAECQIKRNDNYDIVEFISGKGLFDVESLNQLKMEEMDINGNGKHTQHQCHEHQNCHKDHNNHKNHNHQSIESIFIKGQTKLQSKNDIQKSVGQLLWQSNIKVLRIKGVYSLSTQENVYQLQGVDDLFEVKETKTKKQVYENKCKVLVIVENQAQEYSHMQIRKRIMQIIGIQEQQISK